MQNKIFSEDAFADKNIVISGGAGDIGMEIATEFVKAGANKIALLDNNIEQLAKAIRTLNNMGCGALKIEVDLSDENSIENAVTELYSQADHWDILTTAAGIFIGLVSR